jgi:penicillin amidase
MGDWTDQLRAAARRALAPAEGKLTVRGLRERVEVLRDEWGVAYVSATSLPDLWFAQGFVTATERCFQLDLALRAANGRLSELLGDATLPMDRLVRNLGLHRSGARIAGRYDAASRSMMAAFREGAIAGVAALPAPPPEYLVLGAVPELPSDAGSWAAATCYLAWTLSGNSDAELLRAMVGDRLGADAVAELCPADGIDGLPGSAGPPSGSNAWAVAGSRSESGAPLLACDPHLLVQQPGAWLELHLRAPGYEARGVALPFLPGVLIGTTPHHAWGITNVSGDTQDLYEERLDEHGMAALFDGRWEPLRLRREEIAVRGRPAPDVVEVRETRHGPILEARAVGLLDPEIVEGGMPAAYALRWVGFERSIMPSAVVAVARAESFEEFREAVRAVECPGQSFVYADVDDTIGRQCTGSYPRRRAGDGTMPVPGWTGAHEWDGYLPFEALPWSKDPADGVLVSANQSIGDDPVARLIGRDFRAPFRARRIVELVHERPRHSTATFAAMQLDTVSIAARELLPALLELTPSTPAQRDALAYLASWDADLRADSRAAALFQAWTRAIASRTVRPRLGEELFFAYQARREMFLCVALAAVVRGGGADDADRPTLLGALDDALDELASRLGPDPEGWRWGALHRARYAAPLARLPGLGELFTAAELEVGGDETSIAQAAFDARDGYRPAIMPAWRQVIDLADVDRSIGVLPTGQSGNAASPHWNDQARLWADGAHHPLPVTRPAVEAIATTALVLVPG